MSHAPSGRPRREPGTRDGGTMTDSPHYDPPGAHAALPLPDVVETPRITVIGTGYLGATHAICMAVLGFEVLGVDVDAAKVEALSNGDVPFFEPGLQDKLAEALASGRLRFSQDFQEAADFGDVHFICVGTPQ